MFSGLQEILLILLIVLAIFFLPRLAARRPSAAADGRVNRRPRPRLSGPLRTAILASLVWLFLTAVYFKPWQQDLSPYLYTGAAPVALFWGILWIVAGFRRHRK